MCVCVWGVQSLPGDFMWWGNPLRVVPPLSVWSQAACKGRCLLSP